MGSSRTLSSLAKNATRMGPILEISWSKSLTKPQHGRVAKSTSLRRLTSPLNHCSIRVNIHDVGKSQFVIPTNLVGPPLRAPETIADASDLLFNYEPSPFSFWITRRSDPHLFPLFDTRISSLPKTPTSAVIQDASSTALDAFPLIFEDRYLQVHHLPSSPRHS